MIVKNESGKIDSPSLGVIRKILAAGGKLMAVEFTFKKGAIGAVHSHPHEQIGYVVQGSFELEIDGKKEILHAGDTYYAAPDAAHGVVALEDGVIFDVFTPQREDLSAMHGES
ncbi:MAG: cupin domain-containing protein [Candidatus Omnitrophica bacterium]|nr:cupin domain-containing protein [Candidatus Omnitrophota bacterium]